MSYLSIALVIIITMLVLLVAFLIAYSIILQRSNTEYKERNSKLENEMKYFDECKAQENNLNDRMDNITQALTNCSNTMVTCTECCANSSHPSAEIPANYTDLYNRYILLTGINNKLDIDFKELRKIYDQLQSNNTELRKENSELLTNIKVLKAESDNNEKRNMYDL